MEKGYYVRFSEEGKVTHFYAINDKQMVEVTPIGSVVEVKDYKSKKLKGQKINYQTFLFLRKMFLKDDSFYYLGNPVTEKTFEDPVFLEVLKNQILEMFPPEVVVEENSTLTKKIRSKYILLKGEKELITGWSHREVGELYRYLVNSITNQLPVGVLGEDGEPIAFYNKDVVSKLSFKIYSLE